MKRVTILAAGTALLAGVTGVVVWNQRQPAAPDKVVTEADVRKVAEHPAGRKPAVPAVVKKLADPSLHLDERLEAIRSLPTDLSATETTALVEVMRQGPPGSSPASDWYVLVNELMEVLRQPRHQWREFGSVMEGLMKDRHLDPVVRDYAAQHLALWLGDTRLPASPDEVWAQAMSSYLVVLGGEREAFEPVCGTSLMALCDLHDKRGPEALVSIRSELVPLLSDYIAGKRPASLANRISAIQSAGRLAFTEALPRIRELARDAGANPSVRLSSVAALGYFKDPADRPFLEELAAGNDRLRFAAREALKKHQP